jgi:F-type H+-transporting ATPase subunit a
MCITNYFIANPLHQFKITLFMNPAGCPDQSIISAFFIFMLFIFFQQYTAFYLIEDTHGSNSYNILLKLIRGLKMNIKSYLQLNRQIFTLILFTIFEIILVLNINGLAPFSFALTSHIIVTLFLSLGFFVGINLIGYIMHQDFLSLLFLPKGTPLGILLLVIPIEVISYLMRVFSLAIRLFANVLAGHSLLKVIAGFIYKKLCSVHAFPSLLIPLVLSIATVTIGLLDVFISFLQAYIFFVLLAIYLSHAIKLH